MHIYFLQILELYKKLTHLLLIFRRFFHKNKMADKTNRLKINYSVSRSFNVFRLIGGAFL